MSTMGLAVNRYDKQAHAEVVAELEAKQADLAEISLSIHDNANTDEWTEAKALKHNAAAQRHVVLTNEIRLLRDIAKDYDILGGKAANQDKYESVLARFVRKGSKGLSESEQKDYAASDEAMSIVSGPGIEGIRVSLPDFTAARGDDEAAIDPAKTTDSSAQELSPPTTANTVIQNLAFQGDGVMTFGYRFTTAKGEVYKLPQFDEASEMGIILPDQSTVISENNLADFEIMSFHTRTATSGFIGITREALTDSMIDLQAFAEDRGARRIMRRWELEYTKDGDGSGTRALSLQNGSQDGNTTTVTQAVSWEDVVDLMYSVNRAYRKGGELGEYSATARPGRPAFVFGDDMEKLFMKMKDADGRPVWMPALNAGIAGSYPSTIFGYPYHVSMDGAWPTVTEATTGQYLMAFGHGGYFGRRTVGTVEMFRLMDSGTMMRNSIAILVLARSDFRSMGALDANNKTEAVKLLKNR